MDFVKDKSWMSIFNRVDPTYVNGVDQFLDFAVSNSRISGGLIHCPCKVCINRLFYKREVVRQHLIMKGFMKNYTIWYQHGEKYGESSSAATCASEELGDDMYGMLHDAFGMSNTNNPPEIEESLNNEAPNESFGPNEDAEIFFRLLKDAEQELYPGCTKFTKLSFIIRLFHLKCLNGWTNNSFDMLLELLKEAFPDGETLPSKYYEAKKIVGELGLEYKKIDACPNDCMLYWGELSNETSCVRCHMPRYKTEERIVDNMGTSKSTKESKIPVKVLRYFPLIPRLQRLFMSSKTASDMKWHHLGRKDDGLLRHPADSKEWKDLDIAFPSFANEPRNVRLGLAGDGFNPFRTMSIAHSTWPIVLMPYNLPPWLCMKQPHFILSMIIPGPSAPGNDIDVYLQPLIEELLELWNKGVVTYDASTNTSFVMHAAVLWTINDFPAYANLSGWSTKGRYACPCCNKETYSCYLKHSRKFSYMGHRRFLDAGHPYRRDRKHFDGKPETRTAPRILSGAEMFDQFRGHENIIFGKHVVVGTTRTRRKRHDADGLPYGWKKKSIFFRLPYWKTLKIRHNLDVMHIEKNVCDNIIGTLLNIEGKTKDHVKARLDLKDIGIRSELQPRDMQGKLYLPSACFTMSAKEKEHFCKVLKNIKVPDGYSSNISRRVHLKECKVFGLKSHDCHVLMQQLLPLALRKSLPKDVSSVLIDLCRFFNALCSKVINVSEFEDLEKKIPIVLCQLERIFPPAFFDVMIHLVVHLATEAKLGGPVHYRWMYPVERYLLTLKNYVRNRSRPEGSIAEGYLVEESMTFCSRYLNATETRLDRPIRNYDDSSTDETLGTGRPIGKGVFQDLQHSEIVKAHRWVLFNTDAVEPYIREHLDYLWRKDRRAHQRTIQTKHHNEFVTWFRDHIGQIRSAGTELVSDDIRWLARGPRQSVEVFKGCLVNGFRFHTKDRELRRKTQNSGIVVRAYTIGYARASDRNPVASDVTYYGVLRDVIQLDYGGTVGKKTLFKCDWFNVRTQGGILKDNLGFICLNVKKKSHEIDEEPFILASQAEQAFYVEDPTDPEWVVAIMTKPRDFFDMPDEESDIDVDSQIHSQIGNILAQTSITGEDNITWVRQELEGVTVDAIVTNTEHANEDSFISDDSDGDE